LFYDILHPVGPAVNIAVYRTTTALAAAGCNAHNAKSSIDSRPTGVTLAYASVSHEFGFFDIE